MDQTTADRRATGGHRPSSDSPTAPPSGGSGGREPTRALAVRPPEMKWLDTPREELIPTLMGSLYPGAKESSVAQVLDYCEAAGLNVMLKPVHIVPMNVKVGQSKWEWRDVVMPGINHYRTQASRSGQYLGKTEPEFGPEVTENLGGGAITFPSYCKITVYRLVGGHKAEFTAIEFWKENYATKGKDTAAPNAMWARRPWAQLAKCAEAQALRMAFPELVGGETAEEMEGKVIDLVAEEAKPVRASRSLDSFAGGDAQQPVEQVEGELVEEKADPKTAAKSTANTTAEQKLLDDITMPAPVLKAWVEKQNWKPGWKWFNEAMPEVTQECRQDLAMRHNDLLWAVYNSDVEKKGPQSKAATEFSERWALIIPPVEGGAGGK